MPSVYDLKPKFQIRPRPLRLVSGSRNEITRSLEEAVRELKEQA
jgi:hypothetical protein